MIQLIPTKYQIKQLWIRRRRLDDLGPNHPDVKKSWCHGNTKFNLEDYTATGDEPPDFDTGTNIFGLLKGKASKTRYVLPRDFIQLCLKICIVRWVRDWGRKHA